ncbi:MAG: hypothetical protein ACXQS4_02415 [Methermicoccaceae archaeon]
MDIYTVAIGIWAFVATVLAWLYRRISVQELASIVALIQHARDRMSEGGETITPDEAITILDALLDALKTKEG